MELTSDERSSADSTPRRASNRPSPFAIGATLVVVGFTMLLLDEQLARIAARTIPWRGEVMSAGTAFPRFADVMPTIVARTGLVLVAIPLVTAAGVVAGRITTPRLDLAVASAVVVICAVVTGWLAVPHNAFPSNARIHWVDMFHGNRTDDYFYAAARLPHRIFYETPWLWQGINAAIIAILVIAIGRRIGHGVRASSAFALSVVFGGNVTRFSNTAEDVFINLALLFAVILLVLVRRPVWIGLGLVALTLGRPQFAAVVPALVVAELVVARRREGRIDLETRRYVATIVGVVGAGILATQTLFTLIGDRYLLTDGHLLHRPAIFALEPREIDGFVIGPWSGAYVLHFLWVLPLVLLVIAAAGIVTARRLGRDCETTAYFCAISVVLLLMLHEARPLLYFNVRYVTYLLPLLFAPAWIAASHRETAIDTPTRTATGAAGDARARVGGTFLASAAFLAPFSIPSGALELKDRLEARPEVELLDVRSELRNLADDRLVVIDFTTLGSRNYVAYVLRRDIGDVQLVADAVPAPGNVLIRSRTGPSPTGSEPDLTTDSLAVFVLGEDIDS